MVNRAEDRKMEGGRGDEAGVMLCMFIDSRRATGN